MVVLCEMAKIEGIRVKVNAADAVEVTPMMDMLSVEVQTLEGQSLGKISQLLYAKWNEGELPTTPGRHDGLVFTPGKVKFFIAGRWVEGELLASLDVTKARYVGELTEAQVAMLKGENADADPPDFSQGWRELAEGELIEAEFSIEGIETY